MTENKGGFMDSFLDAFKAGNIFLKIVMFLFFGLITATPYLIYNLNNAQMKIAETGITGIPAGLKYLGALLSSIWAGIFIGMSTIFATILSIFKGQYLMADIVFSAIVLIFGTLTLFQPIRLFMNAIDMKKGRQHSRSLVMLISVVIILIIVAPFSYLALDGKTITSGVSEDVNIKEELKEEIFNITEENNNSIIPTINLLNEGGGSNETS